MPSEPFLLRLVMAITWLCISNTHTHTKTPLYDKFIPTLDVPKLLVGSLSIVFAPVQLEILKCSSRPHFLKTSSNNHSNTTITTIEDTGRLHLYHLGREKSVGRNDGHSSDSKNKSFGC